MCDSREDARRYPGGMNASERGAPATSAYGSALRRAATHRTGRAGLIAQPAPLVGPRMYHDSIGAMHAPSAKASVIGRRAGYGGTLPLSTMPQARKPLPHAAAYGRG